MNKVDYEENGWHFPTDRFFGKRLIFRYDRKIPDYFSVVGAP